ncbi:MAG: TIGR04100 family radical SAM protein [Clostridiales bacterium]|nr:TIGR04100 family radical SAM protein [Clostridiales bacterium]
MFMTILYTVGDSLYLNITNKCPCSCVFCIRNNGDSVGDADNLWLEREPNFDDVKQDLDKFDFTNIDEIVFCGYGEPFERLDLILEVSDYIRSITNLPIRVNTNGLSDLINGKPTAHLLKGRIDTISISLNAPTKEEYTRVTRPVYGEKAFDAMLNFAQDCKNYVENVVLTIVDVISEEDIQASKDLAQKIGINLRIREYED